MWTNENRSFYDRSKLRYPSDLTDEEWALVAPEIPPAKRGGALCPRICPRAAQCTGISSCGITTGPWIGSIMCST